MSTVEIRLDLPEILAREAEAVGVLTAQTIESLIREEVHRRASRSAAAADPVVELEIPPPTRAELEATIHHLGLPLRRGMATENELKLTHDEDGGNRFRHSSHPTHHERVVRNAVWLQSHWVDLIPEASGQYVAVAGQQGFIADTARKAQARAEEVHPEDDGILVQFIRPGPRS